MHWERAESDLAHSRKVKTNQIADLTSKVTSDVLMQVPVANTFEKRKEKGGKMSD